MIKTTIDHEGHWLTIRKYQGTSLPGDTIIELNRKQYVSGQVRELYYSNYTKFDLYNILYNNIIKEAINMQDYEVVIKPKITTEFKNLIIEWLNVPK